MLGLLAASLGQVVASGVRIPQPLEIGDVNVLAASVAACGVLVAARVRGL